jgi:hypothetical protein
MVNVSSQTGVNMEGKIKRLCQLFGSL